MWLGDQTTLLKGSHVISHGRRGDAKVMEFDHGTRTNGLASLDVVLHNCVENQRASINSHEHPSLR